MEAWAGCPGSCVPSCWQAHAFGWNDSVNYKSLDSPKKKKKRNKTYRPVQEGTDYIDHVSFNDGGQARESRGRDRVSGGQLLC